MSAELMVNLFEDDLHRSHLNESTIKYCAKIEGFHETDDSAKVQNPSLHHRLRKPDSA